MMDIVFPKNNEEEFIDIAEKLGFSSLCFAYSSQKEKKEISKKTKLKISYAFIFPEKKKENELLIAKADEKSRWLLEKSNVDLVYDFELLEKRDSLHFRASGLNQVLCTIAKEKGKILCFNFNSVLKSNGKARAMIIGRMQQNIMLCRKYKVKAAIASFASSPYEMRSYRDLISFFVSLGMDAGDAKKGFDVLNY